MIGTDIILHQRLPVLVLPLLWLRIMISVADFDVSQVFRRPFLTFYFVNRMDLRRYTTRVVKYVSYDKVKMAKSSVFVSFT